MIHGLHTKLYSAIMRGFYSGAASARFNETTASSRKKGHSTRDHTRFTITPSTIPPGKSRWRHSSGIVRCEASQIRTEVRGSRGKGKVSVTAEFTLDGIWRTAFDECRCGEEEIRSARRRIGRSRVRWNERSPIRGEGVETVTVHSKDCEKASKNPSVTNVREKESQKSVCGKLFQIRIRAATKKKVT